MVPPSFDLQALTNRKAFLLEDLIHPQDDLQGFRDDLCMLHCELMFEIQAKLRVRLRQMRRFCGAGIIRWENAPTQMPPAHRTKGPRPFSHGEALLLALTDIVSVPIFGRYGSIVQDLRPGMSGLQGDLRFLGPLPPMRPTHIAVGCPHGEQAEPAVFQITFSSDSEQPHTFRVPPGGGFLYDTRRASCALLSAPPSTWLQVVYGVVDLGNARLQALGSGVPRPVRSA